MIKTLLKQLRDLKTEDFERCPIWVASHGYDVEEAWHNETGEETFRPWTGFLPVSPSDGIFVVRTNVLLNDGSRFSGFATPALEASDLGTMQPQLFVNGARFGFWGGVKGIHEQERLGFYMSLSKSAAEIFPLKFVANSSLSSGFCAGTVSGFYKRSKGRTIMVEQ